MASDFTDSRRGRTSPMSQLSRARRKRLPERFAAQLGVGLARRHIQRPPQRTAPGVVGFGGDGEFDGGLQFLPHAAPRPRWWGARRPARPAPNAAGPAATAGTSSAYTRQVSVCSPPMDRTATASGSIAALCWNAAQDVFGSVIAQPRSVHPAFPDRRCPAVLGGALSPVSGSATGSSAHDRTTSAATGSVDPAVRSPLPARPGRWGRGPTAAAGRVTPRCRCRLGTRRS